MLEHKQKAIFRIERKYKWMLTVKYIYGKKFNLNRLTEWRCHSHKNSYLSLLSDYIDEKFKKVARQTDEIILLLPIVIS